MKLLNKNHVAVSDMLSYVGMDSTHLVKYLMATIMYFWLPDNSGFQVIKLIPHFLKGLTMMTRCRGVGGALALWLKHWH